jgi:predicted outer membrane repeat protein
MKKNFLALFILLTIVPLVSAQPNISGPLSGTLGPGTYNVVGNISVAIANSLTISPGTTFLFTGNYAFDIEGYLYAVGNETDSIRFQPLNTAISWAGIHFNNASNDSSQVSYCYITGSDSSGIRLYSASPTMTNCSIIDNSGHYWGGGITCFDFANPMIEDCYIAENSSIGIGGGIYFAHSTSHISDCIIERNLSEGGGGIVCEQASPVFQNCIISGNSSEGEGGGVLGYAFADPVFENCEISNNSSGASGGGGVYFFKMSEPIFRNCTFEGNVTTWSGGGVNLCESPALIDHCLFVGNSASQGGGIYNYQGNPSIVNCTFSQNSATGNGASIYCGANGVTRVINSIVEGSQGQSAVHFESFSLADFSFCDYFNNENTNFTGLVPAGMGVLTITNFNGDSCDVYYDIFLNPEFVSPPNINFNLQSTSACVDAGSPNTPFDPDSTIADMGAYYFFQQIPLENLTITVSGANIILEWEQVPQAVIYYIYRSDTPYFDIGGMNPIGSNIEPSFTDENALNIGKYFYRVTFDY